MKRSKAYRSGAEQIDNDRLYAPIEAVRLAKSTSPAKFDATVEVAFDLGVDPRKADQMIRGTVNLPHGTGKTARVLVFANGPKADEARAAGADEVGGDELIEKVAAGYTTSTRPSRRPTSWARSVGSARCSVRVGSCRTRRPAPSPMDVAKAVSDIKGGKIEFRVDKHANLHFVVGKVSFSDEALVENYAAALDEVLRLKPSASKGRYIKKGTVSTTMGPGIPLDTTRTRNLLEVETAE